MTDRNDTGAKGIVSFLVIAVGGAWSVWGVAWVLGMLDTSAGGQVVVALGAFSPAVAAVVVRHWVSREGFADAGLGVHLRRRWLVPARLAAAAAGGRRHRWPGRWTRAAVRAHGVTANTDAGRTGHQTGAACDRLPISLSPKAQRARAAGRVRLPPGQYLTQKWPVLHYGGVPRVDLGTWKFAINGLVDNPLELTYSEMQQLPRKTLQADVHCVTRWSLLDSVWEGTPVEAAVRLAQIRASATHVLVHAAQAYTTNLALEDFLRPENMLVDRRDGQLISPEHGWPLRLFVPHQYFWKSAKWVTGFEFLSRDRPGFWEGYGYHNHGDPWKEERYG